MVRSCRPKLERRRPCTRPVDVRSAWRPIARGLLQQTAHSVRILLPEEYNQLRKRFPKLSNKLNDRFSGGAGIWG